MKGPSATGGFRWPVLHRHAPVASRGFLHVVTAGDSRVAPYWDDWATHMRDVLEGSLGANVLKLENIGVDGWTTTTTLATIKANGLSGVTHLICNPFTNNAQTTIDLATTRQDILDIIDYAQAKAIVVIWLLNPGYYPKASSGYGVITYNDALLPQYRALARWLSGLRGCHVVDMTKLGKPIMSYEAQDNPGDTRFAGSYETGLRDNIHFGPFYSRLVAQAVARVLLGTQPARSRVLEESDIPSTFCQTGWTVSGLPARVSMGPDGHIRLTGRLAAGTKAANTPILSLPAALKTGYSHIFRVDCDDGSTVRINVNGGTISLVDAVPAGASGIYLDGISWMAR